jgi:hypothetical protein
MEPESGGRCAVKRRFYGIGFTKAYKQCSLGLNIDMSLLISGGKMCPIL